MKTPHFVACTAALCCCLVGQWSMAQDLGTIAQQKPISIQGSLTFSSAFYQANGIGNRRQPFNWYLTGAPVISVYGITMPFSLVVSEQERRFSQPFNQYGVSPYYKWITLHAGYRNIRFSEFTLNGANFLGGGVELNPGKFRLGFIYGRFNRAVQEDTLHADPRIGYVRPVYKRMGYAAKLGYGTAARYVDLLLFKAKDDENSIAPVSAESEVTPEDNIALGLKSHLGLLRNRLNFDLDAGISFLTRDTRDGSLIDSANNPVLRYVGRYIDINPTSGFFTAVNTSLGYHAGFGSLRGTYRRVDPGYRSLGAYYFQNDVEQFTIDPSLNVWQRKVSVNLSFGGGRDNLNNKRYATTVRKIYSANVNIAATDALNINLDYANFGVSQNRGVGDLFNDTTAIRVINGNIGGAVSYRPPTTETLSQQFTFSTYYQNTNDLNRYTEQYSKANSLISALGYNLSLPDKKLNSSLSLSYNKTDVSVGSVVNISPGITVSKLFLDDKLRTTLSENLQFRKTNGQGDGFTSTAALSLSYTYQRHTVSLNGGYLTNRYKSTYDGANFTNFSETRMNLSYSVSF